jgi:diguanylate cyclase (GGDEF)-like protein
MASAGRVAAAARAALGGRGGRPPQMAVVVLALLCAAAAAGAAPAPAARFDDPVDAGSELLRVFRDSDGLPQNTVHAITLDQRGYLWVGTQDGAAYYDGRSWTVVNLPNRMRSNFVRCIAAGGRGELWFGTQGGLLRLVEGAWRPVPGRPEALVRHRVNAILAVQRGDMPGLWVATHGLGLWRLQGDEWRRFDTGDGLPSDFVWALLATDEPDGGARLWAGTEGGLVYLAGGTGRFVHEPGSPTASVNSLLETVGPDGAAVLWAGTYGSGVARRSGGRWRTIGRDSGLPSAHVTSLADAAPGAAVPAVWVGTDGGGLARIDGERARPLVADPGLPSNAVYSLARTGAADGTEALWVGTRNGGLARLREGQWRSFRPLPASPWMSVNAVLASHDAEGALCVWFGMDGGGVARLCRGGWTVAKSSQGGLPSDNVQCLAETVDTDGHRSLWVGTRNGGLARFARGRWERFTRESGALPNDLVQAVAEARDPAGATSLWVGTRNGLAVLRGGRWSAVPEAHLPSPSVVALEFEPGEDGGTLWVGTAGGLARLARGEWRTWGQELGLLNDSVQALHATRAPDGRRVLWIGTDGGGVSCFDPAAERLLFTLTDASEPALPNNVVYDVIEDSAGRLYLPTNKGVARLVARAGAAWERGGFEVFTYTWEDGLPRNQCNRGAATMDPLGRVWVGTVGGAGVLDTARDRVDRTPKRLVLDGWVGGDRSRPVRTGTVLPHADRHLVFEYALLSYFREAETEYRTHLVGLEARPSEWGREVRREYRALPPAAYTFRVWGRDYAGNIAGPEELVVGVSPAPWQTWWALLVAAAAVALAVFVIVRALVSAHARREAALQKLVDARTRELSEANQLLVEMSFNDPVTGIANRRRFDERLGLEWKRALRGRSPLALVMIDIDHFKAYNDTYGHQMGDACLRAVARALSDALPRSGDAVARLGGEEFGVILPLTAQVGAARVAEQLRQRVEALAVPHRTSDVARTVTISCGVAVMVPEGERGAEELVRRADEALYRAKQAGRNRTVTAPA